MCIFIAHADTVNNFEQTSEDYNSLLDTSEDEEVNELMHGEETWTCVLVNLETEEIAYVGWKPMTLQQATLRVAYWRIEKTGCVMMTWPAGMMLPKRMKFNKATIGKKAALAS